jgi:hypothetical protein
MPFNTPDHLHYMGKAALSNSDLSHSILQSVKETRNISEELQPIEIGGIASPPHMGDMVDSIDSISPSGDKRRNKLGYQRTTIACGLYFAQRYLSRVN